MTEPSPQTAGHSVIQPMSSNRATTTPHGLVVAPHATAAEAGAQVLAEGGNALEAGIATTAMLAVVYPHMCGLGGDSFWMIADAGAEPWVIDASGRAAAELSPDDYRRRGLDAIPARGPLAANTVAGTVSGIEAVWHEARLRGGRHSLGRLLEPAQAAASDGHPLAPHLASTLAARGPELSHQPGFADTFLGPAGAAPRSGETLRLPRLAETLSTLAQEGLADFYHGSLARSIASDLDRLGSPITADDLLRHRVDYRTPLSLGLAAGRFYNTPAPTQGIASLLILALAERWGLAQSGEEAAWIHGYVEATKLAFAARDRSVADPAHLPAPLEELLASDRIDALARRFDAHRAGPARPSLPGDTVWMGVVDAEGCGISAIHSVFHEFGSGLVLPSTGITWQNRGSAFGLDPTDINRLRGGCRPRHTLNPALADLGDGRRLLYGVMGGEGQPQSQAAIVHRLTAHGQSPAAAIAAPRWLQGRTWGQSEDNLKLETGWDPSVQEALIARGHEVETLSRLNPAFGQAGAILMHPDGTREGASDPRSDGTASSAG